MRGSRNFRQGGGGVRVSLTKKSRTLFFLHFIYLVLSLFYRSQMVISKKSIIFQGSRGGPTFSRGSNFFQGGGGGGGGGSNCLFPIETHITCDFPGGGGGSGPPVPPLDPHLISMGILVCNSNAWFVRLYEL